MRAVSAFFCYHAACPPQHEDVSEEAFLLLAHVVFFGESYGSVWFSGPLGSSRYGPMVRKLVNHNKMVPARERALATDNGTFDCRRLLAFEQEDVVWMEEVF